MIAIGLYATKDYLRTWKPVMRRLIAAAAHHDDVTIIYASCKARECKDAAEWARKELPENWQLIHCPLNVDEGGERYKKQAQLLIAALQGEVFAQARRIRASSLWSVEADVLVMPDSLRVLEWALGMPQPDGSPYYDVAMCTYPNGLFLGGRGDYAHPIAEDFKAEERTLTPELKERYESHKTEEAEFIRKKEMPPKEWQEKAQQLGEEIKKCLPGGNIWEVTAKHGWRPRGWLDFAYPGIGRGALLPTDWVGLGCTLISKRALALATFEGYDGQGTQDLYLCWRRWHPGGLRMAVSTHSICDHVKHEIVEGKPTGKLIHHQALHEQLGESAGHLRCQSKEWTEI